MTRAIPPRLFTVPADVAFLPALARAILRGGWPTDGQGPPGPADLPRWTILLPTRRAARALAEAFLAESAGKAMLLPRIRPLGDADDTEASFADILAGGDGTPLAPAIAPLSRQFLLARLITDWAKAHEAQSLARTLAAAPGHALLLARSLGTLIDSFETGEVPLAAIADLFEGEHAEHRAAILGFLHILHERLPAELAARGLMGAAERRARAIAAEAERLTLNPPEAPVIAAGSTGSVPATARLLAVIARLPQGAVVLPGLDQDASPQDWEAIAAEPSHPQYGLCNLLTAMAASREDVRLLPHITRRAEGADRSWLASEIMRPSATAARWQATVTGAKPRLRRAAAGLARISAPDQREAASMIALMMRETLETPTGTAALITPDRALAARVKAELTRWNITVDDSAGEPLSTTPAGAFMSLLMAAASHPLDPVALLALLAHPFTCFGQDRAALSRPLALIDLAVLRAEASPTSPAGLAEALRRRRAHVEAGRERSRSLRHFTPEDWDHAAGLISKIGAALDGLSRLATGPEPKPLVAFLEAHLLAARAADAPQGNPLWQGPAGETLARLFQDLLAHADEAAALHAADYRAFITACLRDLPVRQPASGTSARLAIYGLLEARLMQADRMILAGLNERVWPADERIDPWLSRPMKKTIGLELPERRIGLSAHDFVQGFAAREVMLVSARKIDGTPAVPARWLMRLEALLGAAGLATAHEPQTPWAAWAAGLDLPRGAAPRRARPPRPAPAAALRPRDLSATHIERLIRDPYEFYAQRILKLEELPDPGLKPDAAARGTVIHAALEAFGRHLLATGGSPGPDAVDVLMACGEEAYRNLGADDEIIGYWLPRFRRIAEWFVAEERALAHARARLIVEGEGRISFAAAGETYSLSARADRLDVLEDGSLRLIDYKTGTPPTASRVVSGFAPQLPLEAAIAAQGGFAAIGEVAIGELIYIHLSGGTPAGEITRITSKDASTADLAAQALEGTQRLLAAYADPAQPYLHLPGDERRMSRFSHLARSAEWLMADDGEEEPA